MKRPILSLLTGAGVSLGLFWLMQAMISNNQQPLKKVTTLPLPEYIKKVEEKEVEKKRELEEEPPPPPPLALEQRIEPKPIPEMEIPEMIMPQPDLLSTSDVKLEVIKKPKPKPKPKSIPVVAPVVTKAPAVVAPAPVAPAPKPVKVIPKPVVKPAPPKMSDTVNANVKATYRVSPKYPKRAARRRQQGWVKVQFIITASGTVKNPFVVASKPSGVFDKEALKAIRRWKFKPKIVNGQPVAQRAVQTIQFKLR